MIKFNEYEGKLFRMLEENEIVPLKENDANVLVRFITHGVIGEYVMEHWLDCNQPNVPIYIDDVDSDGDVTIWIDEKRNEHHCLPFPMFEIIGTLVKEGSDDWAWYQMMNGEKIMCAGMNSQRFYAIKEGCDYCALYENNGNEVRINTKRTYGEFIEYSKMCSISSWEIYKEPKEEPQPAKEPIANCENCKHVCTNSNIDYCHMYEPKPESENIIHGYIPADMHLKHFHLCKVGDWVKYDNGIKIGQAKILRIYDDLYVVIDYLYSQYEFVLDGENIIRKLKPSEVIVKIGCLSGRVEPVSTNGIHIWFHLIGVDDKIIATIRISSLDTQTRELVESLINAQKEEE